LTHTPFLPFAKLQAFPVQVDLLYEATSHMFNSFSQSDGHFGKFDKDADRLELHSLRSPLEWWNAEIME
jgi:hypothetical protein